MPGHAGLTGLFFSLFPDETKKTPSPSAKGYMHVAQIFFIVFSFYILSLNFRIIISYNFNSDRRYRGETSSSKFKGELTINHSPEAMGSNHFRPENG